MNALAFDGKSILLAADAQSEVLEESIARLIKKRGTQKLRRDACKVGHHSSRYHNSPTLIDMLDRPRWLFSTNGDKFQHPDPLTIARILTSRREEDSLLFFNSRSKESAVRDAPKLQKEFHYEPFFPKSKSGGIAIEL